MRSGIRYLTLFVVAVFVILGGLWLYSKKMAGLSPSRLSPPGLQAMKQKQKMREKEIWDLHLATRINFCGKVVDEKGTPIAAAEVNVSFADSIWTGNTKRTVHTNGDGIFHVKGRGLGIVVMVSKRGYYRIKESDGRFGYSKSVGSIDPHPTAEDPAIFVLRKRGRTEPLIKLHKDVLVPSDGTPLSVDLSTGSREKGDRCIVVEAWISPSPQKLNSRQPYDWRCRVSVPGGGLIERKGDFNFEAPESGYQPAVEINAPASLGPKWRSQVTKGYFVKFESGNYARVKFTMTAGRNRFFTLVSYFNPKVGSRNLEFDPSQLEIP